MLQFKLGDTEAILILTLSELVTVSDPYFLFVFTHVTTRDQVAFLKNSADDESINSTRYNQFTIDPSVVFSGKHPGEWHYVVYEQASNSNLDPALTSGPLEYGKLMIDRTTDFEFTQYDEPTSYKSYNG